MKTDDDILIHLHILALRCYSVVLFFRIFFILIWMNLNFVSLLAINA